MRKLSKSQAIERLKKVLEAIPELKSLQRGSPDFEKWHRNVRIAIVNIFGEESRHINDFRRISVGRYPRRRSRYSQRSYFPTETPDSRYQQAYLGELESARVLLESMIEEIEEYWEEETQTPTLSSGRERERIAVKTDMKEVFVIHGRDNEAKEAVARFLARLDLEPVILHEQPNEGRTIIEKFEEHAQAAFAVVLLTPDDAGALENEKDTLRPRARQNVIFEFGYFIGRLGRKRVCALTRGDLEMPSDYDGVLYVPLDADGAWRMRLVKELRAAGLNVDANLAL